MANVFSEIRRQLRGQRAVRPRRGAGDAPLAERPIDVSRLRDLRAHYLPASGPVPWLDRPDAEERIAEREARGELSAEQAERCRRWSRDGYLVLEGVFAPAELDAVWSEFEQAIAERRFPDADTAQILEDGFPSRCLNYHATVEGLRRMLHRRELVDLLALLLGAEIRPFQTLVFNRGSQQAAHSDSIHMTTYPLGYLAASWTAMEDIAADSGPVFYYPGSQRLPYALSRAVGIEARDARGGIYDAYRAKYESHIQRLIAEHGLEPVPFTPRKGDVLLWHANLIHGGAPRRGAELTRRSVVCHYFATGVLCYHDLLGKRAIFV